MAYLDRDASKQEMGIIVDHIPTEIEKAAGIPSVHVEVTESSNSRISRQLKDEKQRLINTLSQFPISALWLLDEYEQQLVSAALDDENALESELSTAVSGIKKQFYLFSNKTLTDVDYELDRQNLIVALQLFPYTFRDLNRLTDLIVYAYKLRGLCYQATPSSKVNNADIVLKRLEGLSHRNTTIASQWFDLVSNYDEQFLFLSSSDMHKYFTEMVFSEHHWLNLRQKLASANSRLVLFIANQYKGNFLDFDDLVQEGQTGLLKAVDRFDYRLGFQFSTYAGYWIRQAISRALSRCERVVRVPCGQVATINKVFRTKEQLIAKTGKEPTIKELAEFTQLSTDEVHTILSISQTAMSLEGSEADEDSSYSPIDYLEQQVFTHSFKKIAQSDLENLISNAIKILNPREAQVICCHFGVEVDNEMTLQEIGAELNLTRERVRQIQVMALNKIRCSFGEQLVSFL